MTAVLEPPPTTERQAPAEPTAPAPATNGHAAGASRSPQPPPPAQRDVPWSPSYAEENPAGITTSVAITFALFGLIAVLLLGVLLGSRFSLPTLGASKAAGSATGAPVALSVEAAEFKLTPAQLHMDAPGELTITFQNKGVVEHDFSIDGVPGKAYAKPGATSTGVFKITKAGTYTFFCSIPGHKEAGMQGTLVVGGASAGATGPSAAPAGQSASSQGMAGMPGMSQGAAPAAAPAAPADLKPLPLPEVAPPVNRSQPATVKVDLETKEITAKLADGVAYKFWTFNGTVPGPMIRVRQGDTVEITLKNAPDSSMTHSIDLHAVTGPGGGAKVMQVPAGQTGSFRFQALNPGVYIYHCATPMVAQHIGNGMYGMIVVEPPEGLPHVDHEYYLMQGDVYVNGKRGEPGLQAQSIDKMLDERADYVVFNGSVGSLTGDGALKAKVGETVRIFFGVGGPNLSSSFHVIGEIFDRVYPEAAVGSAPETNVQTTHVPSGGATVAEFKVDVPGTYTLVDHSIGRIEKGAAGQLVVEGPDAPAIFQPIQVGTGGAGGH